MNDDCVWRDCQDYNVGAWESDCGGVFELNHGTPRENRMLFCCYCGKPLTEAKTETETEAKAP